MMFSNYPLTLHTFVQSTTTDDTSSPQGGKQIACQQQAKSQEHKDEQAQNKLVAPSDVVFVGPF